MDGEAPRLTDDQRRSARAMAGLGVARRQIAKYLHLDDTQLQMMLGDELDQAEADANSKVAKALFTMATQKNNVAAAIFWMKARAGWREKQEIDIKAEQQQRFVIRVPQRLSQQEWLDQYTPKPPTVSRQSHLFTTDQRPLVGGEQVSVHSTPLPVAATGPAIVGYRPKCLRQKR